MLFLHFTRRKSYLLAHLHICHTLRAQNACVHSSPRDVHAVTQVRLPFHYSSTSHRVSCHINAPQQQYSCVATMWGIPNRETTTQQYSCIATVWSIPNNESPPRKALLELVLAAQHFRAAAHLVLLSQQRISLVMFVKSPRSPHLLHGICSGVNTFTPCFTPRK